jgi:hypothetical protein
MRKTFIPLLIVVLIIGLCGCSSGTTSATQATSAMQEIFTVNQTGGIFPDSDSSVVMTFAAGSVNAETNISIATISDLPDVPGYIPGTTYTFGPDGTVFEQPVQLTIEYDPANIPSDLQETMLCLAKLTGRSWQPVHDSKVDTASKTVTGSIAGFSTYGLIGSNMTVTMEPPTCFPGTEVTITPKVENAPPGYKLQYKWSTDGKYGELLGTPDEKTGSIKYKAKVNAPDRAAENITLEVFTYFATADDPPKFTHYTWLTVTTTVTMSFPAVSIESKTIAPREEVTLVPKVENAPPGYKLQFKWNSDQKYGTLTHNADGSAAVYLAKADAPDGATENISVEMFTQFASADTPPILTDYTWGTATSTITIGILSFQFDLLQTVPGVPGTVTTHVLVRNHQVKMVTPGPAGQAVIHLFDYNSHIEYWYTGNEGQKSTIDPSQKSPDDPNYLSQFSRYTKVGTEKRDGKPCRIIQFADHGTTTKVWIWEEKNLPIRIQIASSQGTATYDYIDYEFIPIPDSEFVLPSSVKIR